jgi:prepilin-type N-terminal cleavage/methylation domain-containing protein
MKHPAQAGFSMVEVVLALLIVSIGLLTLVGLMSSGLTTNKFSIEDTQGALFAADVFECARIHAGSYSNMNRTFRSHMDDVKMGPIAKDFWDPTTRGKFILRTGWTDFWYASQSNVVDVAMRYAFSVGNATNGTHWIQNAAAMSVNVSVGLYRSVSTQGMYSVVYGYRK